MCQKTKKTCNFKILPSCIARYSTCTGHDNLKMYQTLLTAFHVFAQMVFLFLLCIFCADTFHPTDNIDHHLIYSLVIFDFDDFFPVKYLFG